VIGCASKATAICLNSLKDWRSKRVTEVLNQEGISKMAQTSTEIFVNKARKVHGDRYDYSRVEYVDSKTKVQIVCLIHGAFNQRASGHLNGRGCFRCVQESRLRGNDFFITKSIGVHGDRYDYSRVEYVNRSSKVQIVCSLHGPFSQKAEAHFEGAGCPVCGKGRPRMTLDEFIQKAKKVHGDKYNYSLVEYRDRTEKIKIICSLHGEFMQRPKLHLKGHGCYHCGNITLALHSSFTTEEFIAKAKAVHGDKYNYGVTEYKNINSSVRIICPIHGEFTQIAASHLAGCGCRQCGCDKQRQKMFLTSEEFVVRARKRHGDRYNYDLVDYQNSRTKVKIICLTHGEFFMSPSRHFSGENCPKCQKEKRVRKVKAEKIKVEKIKIEKIKAAAEIKYQSSFLNSTSADNLLDISLKTKKFIERARKTHGDKYSYELTQYKSMRGKITIICSLHGEFEQQTASHLSGCGCPSCHSSAGERKISRYLSERNITYEREKRFDDCKKRQNLRFDFWLPQTNTLIEFDGRQHEESAKIGKLWQESAEKTIVNDQIKNEYAAQNGYTLIRISYKQVKDIDSILTPILFAQRRAI
jgi:very-short-patch-repair endonuclease